MLKIVLKLVSVISLALSSTFGSSWASDEDHGGVSVRAVSERGDDSYRAKRNKPEVLAEKQTASPAINSRFEKIEGLFKWKRDEYKTQISDLIRDVPEDIWAKLEALPRPKSKPSEFIWLLEKLKITSSLPYFFRALELGAGKKWDLGSYKSVIILHDFNPLDEDDFVVLRDSFKDRHEDEDSSLICKALIKFGEGRFHDQTTWAIEVIREHGKNLSAVHAASLLEGLTEYVSLDRGVMISYYTYFAQNIVLHANYPAWKKKTDKRLSIKRDRLMSEMIRSLKGRKDFGDLTAEFPLRLHPSSWNPRQIELSSEMLPPEIRPVVVFDLDLCILLGKNAEWRLEKVRQEFQDYFTQHPHTITWIHDVGGNKIVQHWLMPYFPVAIKAMVESGWRVVYFSSALKARNVPLIDDTHNLWFGAEAYNHLKGQGQFPVFSFDDCKILKGRNGKDMNTVLLDGENLNNAIMWEDIPRNCHNKGQVFKLDLEQVLFLDQPIPGGIEGAAACLVGFVKFFREQPQATSFVDRIHSVFGIKKEEEKPIPRYPNVDITFVEKLYASGMDEILKIYPEAAQYKVMK